MTWSVADAGPRGKVDQQKGSGRALRLQRYKAATIQARPIFEDRGLNRAATMANPGVFRFIAPSAAFVVQPCRFIRRGSGVNPELWHRVAAALRMSSLSCSWSIPMTEVEIIRPPASLDRKVEQSLGLAGGLILLMGVLAIVAPTVAAFAVEWMTGLIFLLAGVGGFLVAQKLRGLAGSGFRFASSIAFIALGVWLFLQPGAGAAAIALLIGIAFLGDGILRLMHVPKGTANRGWLLFDAGVGILLGLLFLAGWPGSSARLLGLLIGIRLVVTGAVILLARQHFRSLFAQANSAPAPFETTTH